MEKRYCQNASLSLKSIFYIPFQDETMHLRSSLSTQKKDLMEEEEEVLFRLKEEHPDWDPMVDPVIVELSRAFVGRIIARQFPPNSEDGDLHSEGMEAICYALNRFERSRGWRFHSYAGYWVRSRILEFIAKNRTIPQTARAASNLRIYNRAVDALVREGQEPTNEAIADAMGSTLARVTATAAIAQTRLIQLEKPIGDKGGKMQDILPDERMPFERDIDPLGDILIEEWRKAVDPDHCEWGVQALFEGSAPMPIPVKICRSSGEMDVFTQILKEKDINVEIEKKCLGGPISLIMLTPKSKLTVEQIAVCFGCPENQEKITFILEKIARKLQEKKWSMAAYMSSQLEGVPKPISLYDIFVLRGGFCGGSPVVISRHFSREAAEEKIAKIQKAGPHKVSFKVSRNKEIYEVLCQGDEGMSFKEISALYGCSKQNLQRIMDEFRKSL